MTGIQLELSQIRFFSLVLRIITNSPSGKMSENSIIELGLKSNWLKNRERESVPSRTDSRFANSIHNIVSHRGFRKSLINCKFIIWHNQTEEFEITAKGWKFLNDVEAIIIAAKKIAAAPPNGFKNFEVIDSWLRQCATE
jgi:hypothetical protein